MKNKNIKYLLIASLVSLSSTVMAQEHHGGHAGGGEHHGGGGHEAHAGAIHENGIHNGGGNWHGENRGNFGHHDIGRPHYNGAIGHPWRGDFHSYDYNRWQQGRWLRTHHNGQLGWWWLVGSTWYLYSQPVYPYPAMTVPPTYYNEYPNEVPANIRYFCPTYNNYYPYIQRCPVPWEKVIN